MNFLFKTGKILKFHWIFWSLIFWILILSFSKARAYSDFIGYGYTSCMTCHFNGAGGGALNDYGRALFAAEIAAHPFYSSKTDEELGESSGFLGSSTILGDRIKPGFKFRGLQVQQNPGSSTSTKRNIVMQSDLSLALLLNEEQSHILVGSIGYVPVPSGNNGSAEQTRKIISHEYYYRYQIKPKIWIYLGFMDKTFGIRTPDHKSFSREQIGLGQNDQSHGMVIHLGTEKHEFFVNPFVGNLQQSKDLRQQGLSLLYEFQPAEKVRYGAGTLFSKNDYVFQKRAEIHSRYGVGKGNSVQMELGLLEDTPQSTTSAATTTTNSAASKAGTFALLQTLTRVARGVHVSSIAEYFKSPLDSSASDLLRWRLGLLYFPMQRFELRADVINDRSISSDNVKNGSWSLQTQLHLSL